MEPAKNEADASMMIEKRISELQATLFGDQNYIIDENHHPLLASSSQGIPSAISRLIQTMQSKIPAPTLQRICEDMQEIARLERDLHPGPYLTHQAFEAMKRSSITSEYSKPLLYQREEIIACENQFQRSLDQLDRIKELLSLSHGSNNNNNPSSDLGISLNQNRCDFTNAPIIASDRYLFCVDQQVQERLDIVSQKVKSLLRRADNIAYRVDSLVGRYQKIISASSEKVVMLDEEINKREKD